MGESRRVVALVERRASRVPLLERRRGSGECSEVGGGARQIVRKLPLRGMTGSSVLRKAVMAGKARVGGDRGCRWRPLAAATVTAIMNEIWGMKGEGAILVPAIKRIWRFFPWV